MKRERLDVPVSHVQFGCEISGLGVRAHLSFLHPGWQFVAVLPHPYPLPLGEGAGSSAFRQPERFAFTARGRRFSLSQRERAGVRENASAPRKGRFAGTMAPRLFCKKLRCAPTVALRKQTLNPAVPLWLSLRGSLDTLRRAG